MLRSIVWWDKTRRILETRTNPKNQVLSFERPAFFIFTTRKDFKRQIWVALFSVGVGALKFLQDPPSIQGSHVGQSVDYNCTTDDPNATVLLLKSTDFGFSFNVFPVTPNKLLLTKQVFTIVNIVLSDGAQYKCKATDQSGQTIQWPSGSLLFVQAGLYEYNFQVNWCSFKSSTAVVKPAGGYSLCREAPPKKGTFFNDKWK